MNMMLYRHFPVHILFSILMMMGMMISISSNNWFMIWLGLELNMYMFIPLLMINKTAKSKEATVKYFIPQAIGSSLLLIVVLMTFNPYMSTIIKMNTLMTMKSSLLMIALLLKSGLPPLHYWYPMIMNSSPWLICWLLTIPQKIAPIMLLTMFPFGSNSMMVLSSLMLLWSGFMIHNQTNLRAILAYSSIGQMSWIILIGQMNMNMMMMFLMNYFMIITSIMIITAYTSISLGQSPETNKNKMSLYIMIIQILHLGGIPPLMGFLMKLWSFNSLINLNQYLSLIFFLLGSLITLLFYLKLIMYTMYNNHMKIKLFINYMKKSLFYSLNFMSFISIFLLTMLMLPFILTNM